MTTKNRAISALVVLILVIAIAVLGRGILRRQQFDESSREFAIAAALHILGSATETAVDIDEPESEPAGSSPETLRDYAHPNLLQQETLLNDYVNALYFATRFIGELETLESISGGSDVPLLALEEVIPSAAYELESVYSGGNATIQIVLTMHENEWRISEFLVESNQLAD